MKNLAMSSFSTSNGRLATYAINGGPFGTLSGSIEGPLAVLGAVGKTKVSVG